MCAWVCCSVKRICGSNDNNSSSSNININIVITLVQGIVILVAINQIGRGYRLAAITISHRNEIK